MILKYSLLWIPMVFIAILNGAFREIALTPRFTELQANQISCLTGILLFSVYTWLISLRWPLQSTAQALAAGLVWLVLTIAFEFAFGYYVAHRGLESLLREYNLFSGRLWTLVLLAIALLPAIVFKLRRRAEGGEP